MQPGTMLFVLITLEIMKGREMGQVWEKNKSVATLVTSKGTQARVRWCLVDRGFHTNSTLAGKD